MTLTAGELNRATLARQLLLERAGVSVADAVRRIMALQAQHPPAPYIALWNRVAGLDLGEVEAAFASARLVKASLMRVTLHAVHADDHPALHLAMQPTLRAARLHDARFRDTGATTADADGLLPELADFLSEPRTAAQGDAWVAEHGIPGNRVWWALRHYAPIRHAPVGQPWSFPSRPSYLSAGPAPAVADDPDGAHEALQTLIWRYLEAFGPASAADISTFALVPMRRIRPALAAMSDRLEHPVGPDGKPMLDVPDGLRPPETTPAPPRLMAMWDSMLLAYKDRSRVMPDDLRKLVVRTNGDFLPTLLVDGHVAGVWRTVEGVVEATVYRPLSTADWDGLAAEAVALQAAIADRDPDPWRRYDRWWTKLPAGETRMLG